MILVRRHALEQSGNYKKEKRGALELWADRLQGIISGSGYVVAIHAAR